VQVAARAIELDETATAGDSTVSVSGILTGDPTDEIAITVSPSGDLQRVIVRSELTSLEGGAPVGDRFDATAADGNAGAYAFSAGRLGIAGPWNLEITVRRTGVEDEIVSIPVDTSGLTPRATRSIEDRWGGFRVTPHTALALTLAGLMLVIGLAGLRRVTGLEPLASGFMLAASLLIAGGFLVSAARSTVPVTPAHTVANPLDSSPGALTYAGDLYRLNCAVCHGQDGRGAGDANAAHLHGGSADLTRGKTTDQSDGDLRYWIENGVPGTRMPAFGAALSENERWQLVLLIRQVQEEAREEAKRE
jgi:mono/diheme cytochrome c family protein